MSARARVPGPTWNCPLILWVPHTRTCKLTDPSAYSAAIDPRLFTVAVIADKDVPIQMDGRIQVDDLYFLLRFALQPRLRVDVTLEDAATDLSSGRDLHVCQERFRNTCNDVANVCRGGPQTVGPQGRASRIQ